MKLSFYILEKILSTRTTHYLQNKYSVKLIFLTELTLMICDINDNTPFLGFFFE